MPTSSNNKSLLPVYLIVGEDALKREAVLKRLRARLETMGDLSFNSDSFDGSQASALDILYACNTVPFASQVRLVEVKGVEHLKESDVHDMIGYIENPCETTILALVAEKLAKNKKLYKAIAGKNASAIIECAPMKRYELPKTVRSMAVSHGFTLTDRAAHALVDLVGEDTVRLDAEVRKLATAHFGKGAVDESDVFELVRKTTEPKPWELVDALSAKDVDLCMKMLVEMKTANPHQLIGMCTARIRELICVKSFMRRGNPRGAASALHLPDWRVKNHAKWAKGFTECQLQDALISACEAERSMKSGAEPAGVFQEWILSVCR